MKKLLLTAMLVMSLMSQAVASETEPDYMEPLLIGGGIIAAGLLTGGVAWVVIGASAATATAIGSVTIIGGTTYASLD